MNKLRLLLAIATATALTACGTAEALPQPGGSGAKGRLEVVTTAYPLFEASGNIGGSRAHVTNLLPKTALDNDPLTPAQEQQLRDADFAVILGNNTQPRVEEIANERTKTTLWVLNVVHPLASAAGEGGGKYDPYVWLNPANMGRITQLIEDAYASIDPAGAKKYLERREDYDKGIAGVDRMFAKRLASCDRRAVLTTTPVYQYLAERYGLQQVSVAEEADATHLSIAEGVRETGAKAVYFSKLPGLDDARAIRKATGARASTLDPLANQSDQARRGGASYGMVMKLNLDALTEGLGCLGPRT